VDEGRARSSRRHAAEVAHLPRRRRPLLVRRLRRARRVVTNAAVAALVVALGGVLTLLPLEVALAAAGALAAGVAPWMGRPWRWADAHLAIAYPQASPAERRAIARAAFANAGRSFAELCKFATVRKRLATYVRAEGLEHLRQGLAGGKGLLAVTGHLGNWEILAAYCAAQGLPVDVIGRRLNGRALNRMLVHFRARAGVTTILRESKGSSRAIMRTLRANRILALLIDQDTRGPRVFVPFFGRPASTPSGVAVLAQRTGAPVVGIFISRRPEGGHLIHVLPPFPSATAADSTVEGLTATYTAAIEAHVRAHPDEWVWWHRRWRRRPATETLG
jgi:Kdo2-lipid IVA lauroyltransferase/acyltransferase